jgi:hypothetical protein
MVSALVILLLLITDLALIPAALPSWQYEFIIIGALCCAWSVFLFIFVPDSPYHTHWFTRAERLIIVSRKRDDQNLTDNRECVDLVPLPYLTGVFAY